MILFDIASHLVIDTHSSRAQRTAEIKKRETWVFHNARFAVIMIIKKGRRFYIFWLRMEIVPRGKSQLDIVC